MASTNAAKIQDPEKQVLALIFSETSTSSPLLNDDRSSKEDINDHPDSKMSRLQHIILCCVLLAIFTFTVASAAANGALKAVSLEERLRFQELLDSVEPAALHEVLHEQLKDKYQHGVYQEDKTAMEAVHQTNAEVAQSLVELAKRQTNSTASTTPPSSTSVPTPPDSSTSPVVVTPSSSETTTPQQQTSEGSTTTTTPVQSSQTVASTTTPGSTSIVPPSSTPTKASSTSTTTTKRSSATNAQSTSVTPSNPSVAPTTSRSVTQQIVYTTTLANGAPTTITSVTVVPADQADKTGGSATKTNPSASLQTNGGNAGLRFGLAGVLGAIGVVVVGAL